MMTKDFLKERTEDFQAFKSSIKSWVNEIIINVTDDGLKSRFKINMDSDLKKLKPKKPEFNIEDMKREANERKQEEKKNKKNKTKSKSKGPRL